MQAAGPWSRVLRVSSGCEKAGVVLQLPNLLSHLALHSFVHRASQGFTRASVNVNFTFWVATVGICTVTAEPSTMSYHRSIAMEPTELLFQNNNVLIALLP